VLRNRRWMDTWLNALAPMFNPYLSVTEPWRVRKPGVDGIITRYESFDARPL
jgi:putative hemin transport protein